MPVVRTWTSFGVGPPQVLDGQAKAFREGQRHPQILPSRYKGLPEGNLDIHPTGDWSR